ncbi:glycosyltransferase family 2 protein [Aeromonas veronii]|uniref:glycosyltransferase family 2 protein n=1 Tax=Aeromonas veronii TaxID=654 RepID=UPI00343AC63A
MFRKSDIEKYKKKELDYKKIIEKLKTENCEIKKGKLLWIIKNISNLIHQSKKTSSQERNSVDKIEAITLQTYSNGKTNLSFTRTKCRLEHCHSKISIIMTTFNSEKYVQKAIDSILNQSYSNIELIVVDDSSKDKTKEILKSIQAKNNNVKLIFLPYNCGTYWAKNIGIINAKGDYITFMDSDDESAANRIEEQLSSLIDDDLVSICNYFRVDENDNLLENRGVFERICYPSLMLKRCTLDTIGFFDSVRTSADDELYERLKIAGIKISHCNKPLYKALYRQNSLTTDKHNAASIETGKLSLERKMYVDNYKIWHKEIELNRSYPNLSFPHRSRKFSAPDRLCITDFNSNSKIYASLATMPSRLESLEKVIDRILPQVDEINVYLNNFTNVPEFLKHKNINIEKSQNNGDLRDNGKFFFSDKITSSYIITVDDDIIYPQDYVQKLVSALATYKNKAAIGVHGVIFAENIEKYFTGRTVYGFNKSLCSDRIVNLLGTGTLCYHTDTLNLNHLDFKTTGMADIWTAIFAKRQQIPMICIKRPESWMKVFHNKNTITLYEEFKDNDSVQTNLLLNEGSWKLTESPLITYL